MKLVRLLVLPLVLTVGGIFVGTSPAAADRVEQSCTTELQYQVCVSYNYDTGILTGKVQNLASYTRNAFIGLARGWGQPWLQKKIVDVWPGQWRSISNGPIFSGYFCAAADDAGQVVVRVEVCRSF